LSLIGASNDVGELVVDRLPRALADRGESALTPDGLSLRLREINATLLQGHAGAGAYRNTSLPRGSGELPTTPGWEVHRQGEVIFKALEAENHLKGLPKEEFVTRFAVYRTALMKLSPFGGANRNTVDIFLGEVANVAGYQVDRKKINPDQMEEATKKAVLHDQRISMHSVLRPHTHPSRAVAFKEAMRTGQRGAALDRHPELEHAFSMVDQRLGGDQKAKDAPLNSLRQDARFIKQVHSELEAGRLTRKFSPKEMAQFLSKVRELERSAAM
jgi:fido (protein-threonine AMPylation protein)